MQFIIGKPAPDFTAKAIMPNNNIEFEFNLRHYVKNHKSILFFYPLDFTFVCPSEIIALNNRLSQFIDKDTKVVLVSVDSHFSHLAWKSTPTNKGGIGDIQIPMVSDINKTIASAYGVLGDDGIALRGTFLIDPTFTIRHMLINDASIGRNIDETLRMLDAIDYHSKHGEVCPANWQKGQEGIIGSTKGIADYLASNAEKL